MNLITKSIAGAAVATLLLPTLALAHDGGDKRNKGLGVEGSLQLKIEKGIDRVINKDERKDKHEDRVQKQATSTAASIQKQATRIQAAADTMASFNTRVAALIASSSADIKANLETKFAQYQTNTTSAKVEAGKAITTAAQVNASNSTTTNASLLASAKVDLRESKGFLHDAQQALFSILRALWQH